MSKASPYRDLIKANDVVTKSFLNSNTVSVVTETKAGDVNFKSTVSGDKSKFSAVIEPKYEWREQNLVFEGKASTANAFSAKGTYKNLIPDLNLSLQGERSVTTETTKEGTSLKESNVFTGGVAYNNSSVHFSTDVKFPLKGNLSLSSALHAKPVDNLDVGVKVDHELGGNTSVEAKVVGGTDSVEGAVTLTYPSKVWGIHLWHSWCSGFQWAFQVTVPPSDNKKNPNPQVNVAGNYKLDDFTTLKARLSTTLERSDADNAYRAALSLQQKVNSNTTVTVGADVNLNQALGLGKKVPGDASSAGLQISFK